jgi:hypothetical protein
MRQVSIFLRIEAEAASVPQGKLPPMAERGPVQSDARLGTSDEPVQALARRTGRQGSDGALHRPPQWARLR